MLANPNKQSHRYTIDEYLVLEEKSEIRHEFYNGELYAMAGGTINHNRLTRRIATLLENQPSLKRCGIFSENMKVDVQSGMYMPYPDIVLTCHPFDLRGDNLIIRQPRILVEVLSKSTARKDRGFKWQKYRKIESLWYYVLIDQYTTTVELFSRIEETDEWINTIYETVEELIVFPRLNFELSVGAIYEGIELVPENDGISAEEQTD